MNDVAVSLTAGMFLWLSAFSSPPEEVTVTLAEPAAAQPVMVQANPRGSEAPSVVVPNPQSADTPVAPALPADPAYQGGPYKGALTPPPPQAFNKVYPVCSKTVRDSCVNRNGI